uniref:lipoxygenase homology domain-containing protein 1-like n=1 Tax=Styela clava TaxID=7725 RepID=UPI00193AA013|nr:lipoxygenase homology domain-containing protein 1-like [Styela clava]
MSGTTSLPIMPRHPGPPSLSANHRDTFSISHRSVGPHSTISGPPHIGGTSASTPTSRLSIKDSSQIMAKNVLFYRSGDTNFQSFKVAVTKRNFRTFDSLLENLSEKVSLPFGVRTISTPNGTHGISRLDELEDGKAYICSDRKTVKPLNLNLKRKNRPPWFISKPKTRTRRVPTLARRSSQTSPETSLPPRYQQVKTPKKVVIVKNGDPSFRHIILLSRRTHQNFDQILEDVADIFRIKQHHLYSCEGRKIESLQELFANGNVFVLAGKESFIPMEYRMKRGANAQSKSGSSAENTNAVDSARMPKELKRTKGRWRVTVTTSELPAAGTDSRVLLTVYGAKGNSGAIPLNHNNVTGTSTIVNRDKSKKLFMSGNEDEFVVNVGFISDIRKIRISHDNSGKSSPGWLCEEVILSDLTTGEVMTFPFNRWLSRDEDDGEICRELPATAQNEHSPPVLRYIVSVHTGDLWNAGTEANVYITLYGTLGDSGSRLLQVNGKPKQLHKGSNDVFRFEAVDLGTLQRLVVGHDGAGPGAGWYLERIIVREDRVGSDEYIFHCDRWLDESQDDRKIVREIFVETKASHSRLRNHNEKSRELELWDQEKWKFQKGNQIMLISKATGRSIRTKPDGSVDGLGVVSHPFDLVKIKESDLGVYEVIKRRGTIRSFCSASTPAYHLAIDQNRLLGQGKGGTFCEFVIKVQPDRSVMLESCRYPGHYISIDPSGKPADTRGHPNTTGRLFNVYVKGCFRNNSIIIFNTSPTQALVVTGVGDVVGTGKRGDITSDMKTAAKSPNVSVPPQWANFRVIKVAEGVRMFQCEKNPRRYLRIKDGQCDGLGSGDVYCHFKVQKYKQGAYVTLQSMKHRGVFVGLSSNGKARPTVDTGDSNTQFFPEVIKFGEKKKLDAHQYRTPEPSFVTEEQFVNNKGKTPAISEISPISRNQQQKQMAIIRSREFGSPGPNEGDYRIYVTTGNSGTKEVVTITAYGDKGRSGNITLGKGSDKGVFQCGQTDEFEANFSSIGRLYKIRIGVEEASSNCDWRLKQVKMKDMTSNEIFRFKFNRWISRSKDDGDTLRERPVIIEGTDGELEMHRYHIQVRTAKNSSSFSSKKPPIIYLCLFGEKGDFGRRLLQKRSFVRNEVSKDTSRKPFMPNQNDVFEIEAVSLGTLTKCALSCPTSLRNSSKLTSTSSYPAWLCDEIIVRESEGASTEYVFTCKKWLGLKKAGSHATINLSLSEVRDVKQSSSDEADFKDGDWKLCVKTGTHPDAGTSAKVIFYACGSDGSNSGDVILQSETDEIFEPGKTGKFKVALNEVNDLFKVRIGHDAKGTNSAWFVENLKLSDPHNGISHTLLVNKWLAADKESYQVFTEVPIPRPGVEPLPVLKYQVMVYTGSILGSDTDANVYITVHGANGDSGVRPLIKSKTNDIKFQESQMDVFDLDAVTLGELKKIKIGHDGIGHGNGWFLHKVVIKESESSNKEYVFFCNRWLDDGQDDGKIEREIPVKLEEDIVEDKVSDGEYRVLITTGVQSTMKSCPDDAKVTMVIYGDEGKTGEIAIQSLLSGRDSSMRRKSRSKSQNGLRISGDITNCFRPGQTDECKIDIPEIGPIYKIRVSYNHLCSWSSWFLEKIVLEDIASKKQLIFPCNRWLSTADDDQETVREIAVVSDGHETLKTILYNVTIYTGDRHGADTDANIYALIRGDRGDSGRRYFKSNSSDSASFQRGGIDMFTIEAVDLGRLVELVIGHDGEGYGAGWYVEKVTVRAGEFAPSEWVFPCNAWLDDHIGDLKISRRLFPVGVMVLDSHEEELEGLGTLSSREGGHDGLWEVNVSVSEVATEDINRIHLTGVFYGTNGLRKSDIISLGEWSTGGRKKMKTQINLKEIGEIFKIRVGIPDYNTSANLFLENISLQNTRTKEQIQFAFHTQLHSESGSTTKELPVIKPQKPLSKVTRYLIDVVMSPASTNLVPTGKLQMNLFGESGDSGYRTFISGTQSFHATEQKDGYLFKLDSVDLGRLSSVGVMYESEEQDKSDGWTLQTISISIEDHPSSSAVASINSMIYKSEVDHIFKTTTSEERIEKIFELSEDLLDKSSPYSIKPSSNQLDMSGPKQAQRSSEGVWNLTLYYSQDDKEAHEDSDEIIMIQNLEKNKVTVQVFGTRNSSENLHLSALNPQRKKAIKQDMKIVETCLLLGSDMGTLYLVRLGCKQWDPNLNKIKLKDLHTKQEFLFNVSENQHKKMENTKINGHIFHFDIPLVRPDVPPLEHHTYKLQLHTGNLPAANTDADVWVNLYGTHGDTGLRKVSSGKWDSFKKGSQETVTIETVDVGEPRKISVNHNGSGLGAGWFLEDVSIQEERNEKKSDFVFQCNKWLDEGVDEKVIQKDLYLTGVKFHYPSNFLRMSKGSWNCRLKAKDHVDDERDEPLIAKIAFYLKRQGDTTVTIYKTCKFETSEREFEVVFPDDEQEQTDDYISNSAEGIRDDGFYKIRIEVNENGNETRDWPFEELLMADLDSREKLHFVFDEAPVWEGSNRNTVRELPVMRVRKPPLKMYDYYIMFFTASDSIAHSNHNMKVDVMLSGENGDTGWRHLHKKSNGDTGAMFQPGKMEMLFAEAVDLGEKVKSVSLRVGEKNVKWKLDRIKVKKGFFSKEEFTFEYGRWIEPSSAPNNEIKLDLTSTILSAYPPLSRRSSPNDDVVETYDIHTILNIVSDVKEANKENSDLKNHLPRLALKLYGTKNSSDLQFFEDNVSKAEDHYAANIEILPSSTLENLHKIGFGIESFEGSRLDSLKNIQKISLLKLTIKNRKTNEYFSFSPGKTLFENAAITNGGKSTESGTNWLELVPARPKQNDSKIPSIVDFDITIKTGNQDEAGTTANVYIILHGEQKGNSTDSGKRWLLCHPNEQRFAKGSESKFIIKGVDLGDLKQVTVGHDGNDAKLGWFLDSINVKPSNSAMTYVFLCRKWLANLEDDTFIERTLELHDVRSPETIPKRPISTQGINSDHDDEPNTSSRIPTTDTLHGSSKSGENSPRDGDAV